jgi:allantoinase
VTETIAIRARRVMTAAGQRAAAVLIRDGTIADVAGYAAAPADAVEVPDDQILLPGLVDRPLNSVPPTVDVAALKAKRECAAGGSRSTCRDPTAAPPPPRPPVGGTPVP